ncbi:MAG: SLC13 family permease, partial [Bacteroidota bacterium]
IFFLFLAIYIGWLKPAISFLVAIVTMILLGILQPTDILNGFSNSSIASVIMLILITAGIRSNFNLEKALDKGFGRAKTYRGFLFSMMPKVAILSSFVNNTPVVVLMTPYVMNWGKKNNISPSKLLIPLSYSTIIGGMLTIVGTSTTLVLSGFLLENGLKPINSIDLLLTGLTVCAACILVIVTFCNRLLPNRMDLLAKFEADKREYLIEKRLSKESPLIGKTVYEGGLRNLKGVYLVEIVRGDKAVSPVAPQEVIESGDVLIFAGNTNNIVDLTLSNIGVELPKKPSPRKDNKLEIIECVISANSSLIGKTIKESNFRERYDAAVVAIHRNGEKLRGKLGWMKIKAGDVMLMYVGDDFRNRVDVYKDIYIIAGEEKEIVTSTYNWLKLGIVIGAAILLLITQMFTLFTSLLIIMTIMVGTNLITLQNVKRDLDINLVVILVLSIALGDAMVKTGAGEIVASLIIDLLAGYGPIYVLVGLMVVTTTLTSFITNVGAIAISFPLAYAISTNLGIDGAPFYLGIAFAASAAFLTPIGYQTNLIVYGPGGYNFRDFIKIGIPTTAVYLLTALICIVMLYMDVFV